MIIRRILGGRSKSPAIPEEVLMVGPPWPTREMAEEEARRTLGPEGKFEVVEELGEKNDAGLHPMTYVWKETEQ